MPSNILCQQISWKRCNASFVHRRSFFVRAEVTPNPNAMKFIVSQWTLLSPPQTLEVRSLCEAAKVSPLGLAIFQTIPEAKNILIGSQFITLEKQQDSKWPPIISEMNLLLSESLMNGVRVCNQEGIVQAQEDDSELVELIKELIATRIRPAIQDDGGDIQFVSFNNGTVNLRLLGACRGCESSPNTLSGRIEAMLKHYIQEVTKVVQVD